MPNPLLGIHHGLAPGRVANRLKKAAEIAHLLTVALNRGKKTFTWGAGEAKAYRPVAEALGCTLVTKTRAKRMGYRPKRGAAPVGAIYFGSPIYYADVYVLECQFVRKPSDEASA